MIRPTGTLRAATLATLAIVAAFVFSSSAFAADNTSCLGCHGTSLSTPVTDVDRDTACEACHIPGLVGSHPYHQPGANCATACHPSWGDSLATAIPAHSDPSGASFASETSKDTSASVLHIIHSKPRWPAGVSTTFSECGSCHQAAACNACHIGAIASAVVGGKAQHGVHSSLGKPISSLPAYPAWTGTVGRGVVGVDQTVNSISIESNQCASVGCHNLEGSAARRPDIIEDYPYAVGENPEDLTGSNAAVSYAGTWRPRYHAIYTGGRANYSNSATAQLNVTFTGTRIEVISDKDPYRGKAEVWIDGVKQPAVIDCYSSTTVNGAVVFSKGGLSAGGHTISVRPINQKNVASRATYVLVDGFNVYGGLPESIAPNCTSCHPLQESGHGFSHEATHTAGFYGGKACTDCHSVDLVAEHARSSSKTSAATCAACHVTYAEYDLNTYDFTCGGTGTTLVGAAQPCHSAAQLAHTFTETTLVDAAHIDTNALPGAALAECWSCHGKNLVTIHSNSVTSNDPTFVTDCLTCHSTSGLPATADCTNAACHTGTGVHSMATHPAPPHPATNNGQATVPFTGGKTCSACHALEIANPANGEHAKATSVTSPGGAAVGCVTCHAAAYFPATWLDTPGTTNTCIACHPVAGGKAGPPHEAVEYAAKHDATSIAAACSGGTGSVTLFTDGFESGNFTAGGWTNSGMIMGVTVHAGAFSAAEGGTGVRYIEKTISTLGYATPTLSAWFTSTGLDAGPEYLKIIVDGTTRFTSGNANAAWNQQNVSLPVAGAVTIRVEVNTDNANDAFFVDDVLVTGQGGSCHNVSDLAAVHSNSVAAVTTADTLTCTVCHKDNIAVPTTLACASTGCHTGSSAHASLHATAASGSCTQCHENASVQDQHAPGVIGASVSGKPNDGCNICHGGGGWTNVRSGLTDVECVTCHNGALVGIHVYGPYDPNHYPVASHAASGVDAGILRTGGKVCSTCHSLDMKAEHNKSCTSFALGGYADTCVACHEIKVDSFTGAWDDTCLPCHAAPTVHTAVGYDAAHNFATYNAANTASCGGANCHNVALADVIHSSSLPGNGDCTSCHDTNTGVPTERLCTDCHAAHNTAAAHASGQAECTGCHTSKANISTGHASCATCHADARLSDYLNDAYTATCTDCHATGAGKVGTYTYTPADANHYTPYLVNHTASPWTAAAQGTGPDGAVPAEGKECSGCHTSTLKLAHASTSTSGGSVTCVECHTNATLGSAAQVTASWANQRCTDCHDTGAARTHDAYATAHVVSTARGCAASGSACHAFTDLAKLHNVSQGGGTPKYASCANAGCHTVANTRPPAFPLDSCGTGSTGCHQDKTTTNHGGKHDLDVATSDYVNATQSGCTNSGAGCHGADVGANIVNYHPASACTGGPCHTSLDIGTHLQPHTCQGCHDGTYDNAPDTVALADLYPLGHYSEATHTATPATTASAGGTTSAACSVCHAPVNLTGIDGLYFQHQGLQVLGSTTCSECHNANAAVAALVTDATRTNTCVACHTAAVLPTMTQHSTSSRVPVSATEADGAGSCVTTGCHATLDLHQLHKGNGGTDPSCTESLCHDSNKQGWRPTAKTCGTAGLCHKTDPHDPNAHITLASAACVVCHESADLKIVHGGATSCGTCHGNGSYPTLPIGKLECTSCHVAGTVGAKTYVPIDPGHYTGTSLAHSASSQAGTVSGFACTQCHNAEMKPEHITKSTSVFGNVPATYADKCIACHEGPVDAWNGTPWVKTCDACHATKHTATATAHDATGYDPGCAPTPQAITVETQGFETGGTWPATWTRSDAVYVRPGTNAPRTGTYTAEIWANSTTRRTVTFQKTFDLSALTNPTLEFYYSTTQLEAPDYAQVQVSYNGTTFTDLLAVTAVNVGWTQRSYPLTAGSTVTIRFMGSVNATTEFVRFDDILVSGTQAIGCHNVSDVAALHAPSVSSCSACHKDNTAVPTALACDTSGCHSAGGHGHELDVAASAGCYNSGTGCHTELSTDYSDHHVDSGCTNGLCHDVTPGGAVNPSKASHPNPNSCQDCHDSTYTNAPDTVALTDAFPNGHYNETTHTAGVNQMNSTYTYNTKTTACSACHNSRLGVEHSRATSALSGAGTSVCTKCHNDSATVSSIVKTSWPSKNTTTACSACHANTDGTSAATAHGAVAGAHTATSVTGCTALGAGCHGTSATPDLTTVHASGCALTRACHSTTVYNPGIKTCTNAACHSTATYNTTTYAHGTVNGTDATHQVTGASMATTLRFGAGTTTATCATCHSSALKPAHNFAAGFATASLTWTNECRGCHNATTPIDVAALVTANTWTNTCMGNGCHNTTQQAHVDGGTDVPAVAGVNSTTPACTKSGCHSTLELHELHMSAPGGCGLSDPNGGCHTAANMDKRPTQKTCGNVGGCHEGIQNDGSHGVSSGGTKCDVCHSALTGMVNDTTTYHHVLDDADPFQAPVSGSYPTSTGSLACTSCHVDHNMYSALPGGSGKAYSIRSSATVANPTAVDTDAGVCLSCHTTELARNTTGQKANIIPETKVWSLNATWWAISPHNYNSPGTFNDGSTFRANCAKCHGSLLGTLSSGKFATHFSSEQRILNALGDAVTPNVNEEQMCFRCHSKTTDALAGTKKPSTYFDWYGTQPMGESNVVIYSQMTAAANTNGHKPHLYANKHLLSQDDETQAYISANKHVECADCHNHHVVGDVRHEWGTTNAVSEAIRGVTGQSFNSAALSTVNRPTDAQVTAQLAWKTNSTYEYEICFKCHSGANTNLASWGGTKTGAVSANRWTNVAVEFNVGSQSRHPVLAPNDAYADAATYGTSKVFAGQLSGIWAPGDTMYCSDCHGDSTAPAAGDVDNANHAQGPHGSSVAFSLRGPNTAWPINPGTGLPFTLQDAINGAKPFCSNCHENVAANKVHARNPTHKASYCINCHVLIPHGSGMSRLLGDGDGAMPARYAYNNDKSTMLISSFLKRADPNTYTRGDCRVTVGATACVGGTAHTGGSDVSKENW